MSVLGARKIPSGLQVMPSSRWSARVLASIQLAVDSRAHVELDARTRRIKPPRAGGLHRSRSGEGRALAGPRPQWLAITLSISPYASASSGLKKRSRSRSRWTSSTALPVWWA